MTRGGFLDQYATLKHKNTKRWKGLTVLISASKSPISVPMNFAARSDILPWHRRKTNVANIVNVTGFLVEVGSY